jgi:hypothetical protein
MLEVWRLFEPLKVYLIFFSTPHAIHHGEWFALCRFLFAPRKTYSPEQVCVVRVQFDEKRALGNAIKYLSPLSAAESVHYFVFEAGGGGALTTKLDINMNCHRRLDCSIVLLQQMRALSAKLNLQCACERPRRDVHARQLEHVKHGANAFHCDYILCNKR